MEPDGTMEQTLQKDGRAGMAPVVHAPGHSSAATLGGWGFAISKFTRNPDAAWRFVQGSTAIGENSGAKSPRAHGILKNLGIRAHEASDPRVRPGLGHLTAERCVGRSRLFRNRSITSSARNPVFARGI